MLNWLGLPVDGVGARRRDRPDDRARALADARAVRRLGRVLRVRRCSVSARARTRRRATPARRASCRRASRSPSPCIEVVLLVVLRDSGVGHARRSSFPAESEAVVVRVVGEQFAWNVHYPGADGKFGRTDIKLVVGGQPARASTAPIRTPRTTSPTINQLNVPVDRPVLVHLSSKDVIHSFGLYRDAREAGRHSRPRDSRLVRPDGHDRRDARPNGKPDSTTRSPARSCAASATTGCAASSPSRATPTTGRGWPTRSRRSRSSDLT